MKNFVVVIVCRGWTFRTDPMTALGAERCVNDFVSANPGVPKPLILEMVS